MGIGSLTGNDNDGDDGVMTNVEYQNFKTIEVYLEVEKV